VTVPGISLRKEKSKKMPKKNVVKADGERHQNFRQHVVLAIVLAIVAAIVVHLVAPAAGQIKIEMKYERGGEQSEQGTKKPAAAQ
jgi:hypothetical protein